MTFDIVKARQDTPGCEERIFFDNAGASLMPQCVIDAQIEHIQLEAKVGGYEAANARAEQVANVYASAARLINAQTDEIALVENATVAWQLAFASVSFQPGDRILTANASYASNFLNFLLAKERYGVSVEVIPADASGQISTDALADMMDERVRLIAITHVPTNGGLVNPAAAVGKIARQSDAIYLLDACQSVGQLPIDVTEIGCDFLSTTGRKWLRGPRGSGFLFVRQDVLEKVSVPFVDLHAARWVERDRYELRSDARRFENWEYNYGAVLGFGAALDYAQAWGIDAICERVQSLAGLLREKLRQLPGVTIHDIGQQQSGLVTFSASGAEAADLKLKLAAHKITLVTSTPFSTRLDAEARQLPDLVRASIHYYNTVEEIDRFCQVLGTML